ncbi:MAG: hypothetical protein ACRDRZ_08545 [Pseudonocardiaceae bacterium]
MTPRDPTPTSPQLPRRPRLAPGRSVLWRSPDCVQLGLHAAHAVVLDGLPVPLAALVRGMDGTLGTAALLARAVADGADRADALAVIGELHRAGLVVDDAGAQGATPTAPGTDVASWSMSTGRPAPELLAGRRAATVYVNGSGRVAVALATSLAAAGVGRVVPDATGTVRAADLGTGYLPADVGRPRGQAVRDVLRRCVPSVRTDIASGRGEPDVAVLADAVVPAPASALDLVVARTPHLAVYAHEGVAVIGPLVLPGRSACLRCVQLRRGDADPAWPKLAAQLSSAVPSADLGCTQVAAAMAVEQVLAVLAGPVTGLDAPPTWNATLELDPVRGLLHRREWAAHPRCGCGAAP